VRYNCDQCEYEATTHGNLARHRHKVHI
jgi:hypothetical protein